MHSYRIVICEPTVAAVDEVSSEHPKAIAFEFLAVHSWLSMNINPAEKCASYQYQIGFAFLHFEWSLYCLVNQHDPADL